MVHQYPSTLLNVPSACKVTETLDEGQSELGTIAQSG